MKRIYYIALILSLFLFSAFQELNALPPNWSVNPANYSYSMTITGTINIDGVETQDNNDIIAAFVGDECRGVVKPSLNSSVNRYIAFMLIYSNAAQEDVTFKIYDASSDEVRDVETSIVFGVNDIIGQIDKPYIWSDPTLSNESQLLTFGIPNQEGETIFNNQEVSLLMPYGTDLTNLIAEYTTSDQALVRITNETGTVQQSAFSVNNFSSSLNYWVRSADETDTTTYTITVGFANYIPSDIFISETSIDETIPANTEVLMLSSQDFDNETQTYSLVAGTGDTDNSSFYISGDTLKINAEPDYETQTSYSVRIETNDNDGGVYSKEFVLEVIDFNDEVPMATDSVVTFDETIPLETVIIPVQATDADISPEFHTLDYTIVSGNESSIFEIDNSTGIITLVNFSDFEITFSYNLEVEVSDGLNTDIAEITINFSDINDEIPVMADTIFRISEFASIGDVLGVLEATDADADSELTFTFSSDSDDGTFSITEYGEVALAEFLDFEQFESYTITVEIFDGVNTGTGTLTIEVIDFDESTFKAYNTFSPNNDGINDFWEIEANEAFRNCDFTVYNNTGQIVFESHGYNDNWDGKFNGEDLPIGVYFYHIKSPECPECKFVGTISLIR